MFFHHEEISFSETISRTAFLTSLTSFLVFLFLDFWLPGFVSRSFSVFWFLLATIIFGFWWSCCFKKSKNSEKKWWFWLIAAMGAIIGAFLVWRVRTDLKDGLLLILPLAFITPFLVLLLIRENK